jgi:hypothetical protein
MNQSRFCDLVPAGELQQLEPFMTRQNPNRVEFTHVHSEAICSEVGERLRSALPAEPARLPPDLLRLTKQLDSVTGGDPPFRN